MTDVRELVSPASNQTPLFNILRAALVELRVRDWEGPAYPAFA